jgi:hypothetical protein
MLKPKKGFENTVIEYRVGQATIKIKASDITQEHIDKAKHYVDLAYFVEEIKEAVIYDPEKHDAETVMQSILNEPKKKRTRRKK